MSTVHTIRVRLAQNFSWCHYLHILRATAQEKRRAETSLAILASTGAKVSSLEELLKRAQHRIAEKKSLVCHVIGSGCSVNESHKIIKENDFVIGFNYAGILPIKFDLYFVEFGGAINSHVCEQHAKIIDKYISKQTDLIFFKNIAEEKNDTETMLNIWRDRATFIGDYLAPCESLPYLNQTLEYCLKQGQGRHIPQYASTAVTAIFLAYFLGFKKIVLHGVDFGGYYFYEEPRFSGDVALAPPSITVNTVYGKTKSSTSTHVTAKSAVGLKESIMHLHDILKAKNTTLYAASSSSQSAKILPLFTA